MNDADGVRLVARAFNFAARCHAAQRRKGEVAEPYINHLAEVAHLLAEASGGDAELVAAALLHDAIEDQGVPASDLVAEFGPVVAGLVVEVTDDKSLPKPERKRLQVERTPHKSPRAKLLKLADKVSNLRSLAHAPPSWPVERQRAYVAWADRVVATCRGASPALDAAYAAARAAALAAIEGRA